MFSICKWAPRDATPVSWRSRFGSLSAQCVPVWCSVLQFWKSLGSVCCSVLQCVAVCCSVLQFWESLGSSLLMQQIPLSSYQCAVCCSVLQLQWVSRLKSFDATHPSIIALVYSVLQCVAVCCSCSEFLGSSLLMQHIPLSSDYCPLIRHDSFMNRSRFP